MKKKLIYLLCILITVAGMAGIWYMADQILIVKRTDGILPMQDFYAQKENTVDVLLLGSSHTGMNLDASAFWTERGQSAYALWGSIQPFWSTYHFLVEALKTQQPKAVILDVYAATFDFEYSDSARQAVNVCGMRPSLNKWEAIKVSAPRARWFNLLLGLPVYHNRYGELSGEDFKHFPWSKGLDEDKGTYYRYSSGSGGLTDVSDITETVPLMEKEETYLRKIIELCREKEIPLVPVLTPTTGARGIQPVMNTVAAIAAEYGIPFYNFNLLWEDAGIFDWDFTADGHLSTGGARKVSGWLAARIAEDYGVPDHRGDPAYRSWDKHAQTVNGEYIRLITGDTDYCAEILRDGYDLVVVRTADFDPADLGQGMAELLAGAGADPWADDNAGAACRTVSREGDGFTAAEQALEGNAARFGFDGIQWDIDLNERRDIQINGRRLCALNGQSMVIAVVDPAQGKCVDAIVFSAEGSDELAHCMPET